MQLTPRILRFIRLLPPSRAAVFAVHSGQVAMNICIQLWPSKATDQFVRHISPPSRRPCFFSPSLAARFLKSVRLSCSSARRPPVVAGVRAAKREREINCPCRSGSWICQENIYFSGYSANHLFWEEAPQFDVHRKI